LAAHPARYLIRGWNWKSAVTSAMIRGAIFFSANLKSGLRAATSAMIADMIFRIVISGFYGSLTQAFRKCRPIWAATLFVMLVLPACLHGIEIAVHLLRGTPQLVRSITASIIFTMLATLFNYYAMRRGVLVVGAEQRPFLEDLRAMPGILGGFLVAGPVALWKLVAGKRNL